MGSLIFIAACVIFSIYLFLVVLGLVAACGLSLIAASRGYSWLCGLLTVVASLVSDHALVVVAPRL